MHFSTFRYDDLRWTGFYCIKTCQNCFTAVSLSKKKAFCCLCSLCTVWVTVFFYVFEGNKTFTICFVLCVCVCVCMCVYVCILGRHENSFCVSITLPDVVQCGEKTNTKLKKDQTHFLLKCKEYFEFMLSFEKVHWCCGKVRSKAGVDNFLSPVSSKYFIDPSGHIYIN